MIGRGYESYKEDGKIIDRWIDSNGKVQMVVMPGDAKLYSHVLCGSCGNSDFPKCTEKCRRYKYCKMY